MGDTIRTTVALDRELIEEALALTGCKTKRAVIEEALRLLTRVKRQEQVRAHHGKLHWEGDLDALRTDRGGEVAG